jgi:pantoate--beta-alanine ligase
MFAYNAAELAEAMAQARTDRKRVVFVPTMGALHEGHLSLIKLAREHGDFVVVSIFVNPLQFGDESDYERYPRNLAVDAGLLAEGDADLLFAPDLKTIYPDAEPVRQLRAGPIGQRYEGAERRGHFDGMLTVVNRLFDLVQPDVAIFGQKDAQQLLLVRRLVAAQLAAGERAPLKIVAAPTVRDEHGLALSSRNQRLKPDEIEPARSLNRALVAAIESLHAGGSRAEAVSAGVAQLHPAAKLDYLDLVSAVEFEQISETFEGEAIAIIAARVGEVRLIDNEPVLVERKS